MHRDPLINIPIPHRIPGSTNIQLSLTPDQRRGEPEDYIFRIRQKSMQVKDPMLLAKQVHDFATSTVPSIMQTGMIALQMGQQFNPQKAISDVAEQLGILEDIQDWFNDPEFQAKIQLMQQLGPQGPMKATQQGGPNQSAQGKLASPMQQQRSNEQTTANASQSAMKG